jgi:beta-hydroxylase
MIRKEALAMLEVGQRLPAFHEIVPSVADIGDQNWMTFMFLGYGVRSQTNLERCPETAKALAKIPGLVTAFYSILTPGKHIPPHRGPYNGVLRAHLALIVPEPNEHCWIKVDQHVCHWHEGEVLLFDDSWHHFVQNDTDGYRVVLFIDFERPLYNPARFLNRTLLALSRFTPMIRSARRAQAEWERGVGRRGGVFDQVGGN